MAYDHLQQMSIMSIWEVGHRWAEFDPDETTQSDLPKEVRGKIREILSALHTSLNLLNSSGEREFDSYIPLIKLEIANKARLRADEYLLKRQFPKDDLDTFYIHRAEFMKWCLIQMWPLPSFWFGEDEIYDHNMELKLIYSVDLSEGQPETTVKPPKLKPAQRDKLTCQANAKTLWAEHPDMRIAEVIKEPAILIDGNGKLYTAKTLRKWVGEVASDEISARRGRPRKDEKSII